MVTLVLNNSQYVCVCPCICTDCVVQVHSHLLLLLIYFFHITSLANDSVACGYPTGTHRTIIGIAIVQNCIISRAKLPITVSLRTAR